MSGHSRSALLIACVFLAASCGDLVVEPSPAPQHETFATFTLEQHSVSIDEGGQSVLTAVMRNQAGRPLILPPITFSSSSPSIADVSPKGYVTAFTPGTAIVYAKTTFGSITLSDSAIVTVRKAIPQDSVILNASSNGWTPTPAHVKAGGKIIWHGGVIAAAGVPVTAVYLWKGFEQGQVQRIDFSDGNAALSITLPGIYNYCSNACWDTPEYGVIVVH